MNETTRLILTLGNTLVNIICICINIYCLCILDRINKERKEMIKKLQQTEDDSPSYYTENFDRD